MGVKSGDGIISALYVNVLSADESLDLNTDESYTLVISEQNATIVAQSVYGALHGIETFSQLLVASGPAGYQSFEVTVIDAPRFRHRGIMIDTTRHWMPVSIILFNLDIMAFNKFNVMHWHIVDDVSFPYVSTQFPDLSGKGAYNAPSTDHTYSPSDVQQIIAYAKQRGIRVVIEFDTPGHTQSWGPGVPGLLTPCYTNGTTDGSFGPINPIDPVTFPFLTAFFEEVASVFPDQYIHVGGDEVSFSCWQSNPQIQQWMAAHNYTDYAIFESYYEQNLLNIVNHTGKDYIGWQEIFDNGLDISPNTVVNVWKDGSSPSVYLSEMYNVTKAGFRALLSSPWYLNYISYGSDWPKYYASDPLAFNGTQEQYDLVMGGEACLWAEYIDHTNFLPRLWPRASAVGERLWSNATVTDVADATTRIHNHRCRLLTRGVPAEPPTGPSFCVPEFTYVAPAWSG